MHEDITSPILSPSLLSCDFSRLHDELIALERAGLSWAHWDVMDGHFVPNITFGPPIIKACREATSLLFDVHLMIENPDAYLDQFVNAGADLLCVHVEACPHLHRTVSEISRLGAKPAVALNPHTPLSSIEHLLPQLFMVLIMSVNPGFGGQRFIPFSLKKIRRLRSMIENCGSDRAIDAVAARQGENHANEDQQGLGRNALGEDRAERRGDHATDQQADYSLGKC